MKGVVIKSTGSWYNVLSEDGQMIDCRIKGVFRIKGIKTTNPIAVGDSVLFELEEEGKGVIHTIHDRKNYIIRKSINLSKQSHIIAANMDQALLIATLALPRTSAGFIDRFLLTAEAYHIPVSIVFNKIDLFENDPELMDELNAFIAVYEKIGYKCYKVSATENKDIEVLRELTKGKTTLVSGHSGVGKSTLVNAMDKQLNLKVGEISDVHFKGKHTTTFAEMHPLSYGGFIIDTPGIKELGLVDMEKEEIADYFPEMRALRNECKFNNCMHINEPKCAVLEAVEKGEIAASRYNSYLGIINGEEMENTNY
ncbi:MAG: ribosome small subunit-dependent GTPase A [Bacteroidetes bacterium]|nr:ribosome small subunit-dependent GTPase A [Bacteroidota bacterium]MCK6648362.1 ribosome small subunit-dependent GTPase A [Bacteroidia bacterium]